MVTTERAFWIDQIHPPLDLHFPLRVNVFYAVRDLLSIHSGIKVSEVGEKNSDGLSALHVALFHLITRGEITIQQQALIEESITTKVDFPELFNQAVAISKIY